MTGWTLRPATADDLPALAQIERDSFDEPWPEDALRAELERDGGSTVVARTADAAVGYACFLAAADEAELLRIAVAPRARRCGLGRALLRHGLTELRRHGAAICFLEVRADNAGAVALYLDLGFEEVGRRRRYYSDRCDALLYRLRLAGVES